MMVSILLRSKSSYCCLLHNFWAHITEVWRSPNVNWGSRKDWWRQVGTTNSLFDEAQYYISVYWLIVFVRNEKRDLPIESHWSIQESQCWSHCVICSNDLVVRHVLRVATLQQCLFSKVLGAFPYRELGHQHQSGESPVGTLWFVWVGERACSLGGTDKSTWVEQSMSSYWLMIEYIKMRLDGRLQFTPFKTCPVMKYQVCALHWCNHHLSSDGKMWTKWKWICTWLVNLSTHPRLRMAPWEWRVEGGGRRE